MILYQDCLSHLDSSKNMATRGRGLFSLYIYIVNFENLLVRNHWTDFHIILQKCSFNYPLPRLFKPFGFVKKHGRQAAGLIFPVYLYRKLKKSSCQKPMDRLGYNLKEMFLWWSSTKIVQAVWIRQKNMAARGRGLFSLCIYIENFKNLRPRWLSWMRRPTGDQEVAGSTPAEVGNILSWRLIMKYFLRSFSPFRWFKKGSCQFLAKECANYWLTA